MERYHCQTILPQIGQLGQEKLSKSTVTIVGVGALGTASAEILARAGVGRIRLIDFDVVDKKNLHRQTLFTESDVGQPKAEVAADRLSAINSEIKLITVPEMLSQKNARELLGQSSIVLDCTDNFDSRHVINEWCYENKMPWIHAAGVETKGVVMFVHDDFCFNCVFGDKNSNQACSTHGIIPTLPPAVASIQVSEALKYLLGTKVEKRMIRIDVWNHSLDFFKVTKRNDCEVCNG